MSNEDPIIKPTIEIETRKTNLSAEQIDREEGFDGAFDGIKEMLIENPAMYYIEESDKGVSVKFRSNDEVVYFTDLPQETGVIKILGLTKKSTS